MSIPDGANQPHSISPNKNYLYNQNQMMVSVQYRSKGYGGLTATGKDRNRAKSLVAYRNWQITCGIQELANHLWHTGTGKSQPNN